MSGTPSVVRAEDIVGDRKRLHLGAVAVLTVLLVLIGGLRFARMDVAGTSFFARDRYYTVVTDEGRKLLNLNIDISQYIEMTEWFRGNDRAFYKQEPYPEFADEADAVKGPVAPFIYRPALPFIASLLPFSAPESFALVNLALVVLGLWLLLDALYVQGRSPRAQLLGGILYTVALPVLVFASALYIDGGTLGVLMIGYWLIVRRWWWAVVAFLPLSYLVKEVLIILAPVAAWAWRTTGHRFRDARFITGAVIAVVGWEVVARLARLPMPDPVHSYNVLPKLDYLVWNLTNVFSAFFVILGTLPVAVPAVLAILRLHREQGWKAMFEGPLGADLVGLAVMVLLNVYSLVSTDFTLRTVWLIWPFAIALGAWWYDQRSAELAPPVTTGTAA